MTIRSTHSRQVYLSAVFLALIMQIYADIQLVPRFTYLPPSVSYFTDRTTTDHVNGLSLMCRAWPPNALLYIRATTFAANDQTLTSLGLLSTIRPVQLQSIPTLLTQLPNSLGTEQYGILPSSQLHTSSQVVLNELLRHPTLSDAIRERPASGPSDEVGLHVIVSNSSQAHHLETVRLHCMVGTQFGHLLSPPFHVVRARIGEYPPAPQALSVHTVDFLINNIAVVHCELPFNGYPKPTVQFELNGTVFTESLLSEDRYRVVWHSNGQRVSLLIHKVHEPDVGTYRCLITNPLTGEKTYAPSATQLKVIVPKSPVEASIIVPLVSNSSMDGVGNSNPSQSLKIVVEEGQNVTLFCVIQAAPPPTIATYPFNHNSTSHSRFLRDSKFGLLRITNVQPQDAGFYVCSDRLVVSTAHLHVKSRLRLTTVPQNITLSKLGVDVQFKCASSDRKVTPYWLFNGQSKQPQSTNISAIFPAITKHKSILTLNNVTRADLGIYQCVAQRLSDYQRFEDEWVSASATLILAEDQLYRTATELSTIIAQRPVEAPPELTSPQLTPQVHPMFDNLAIYLNWEPLRLELSAVGAGMDQSKMVEYRLEYSVQLNALEEQQNTTDALALIGLVGHEAVRWSEASTLQEQTTANYFYVTDNVLQPSKRYRFRVLPLDSSTGVGLIPPSDWSSVVSMEHISAVKPPIIKMVRPLTKGRVHIIWDFGESTQPSVAPGTLQYVQPTQTLAPVNKLPPFSGSANPDFMADHFRILARPLIKPKRSSGDPYVYGTYIATEVKGSQTREGVLSGLNQSAQYQVTVYGVRGTGDQRQITRFSKAAYVNLASATYVPVTNNRMLYFILGGIAALMVLVVFIFILLCLCRTNPDRRMRSKPNGFAVDYKDHKPEYIPVSTTDRNTCGRGTQSGGGGTLTNGGGGGAGGAIGMNQLPCSAFSDHSQPVQHPPGVSNSLTHQQQQQYQAEQYAALLQQQQQFQQQQQGGYIHPPHHQSHHSLMLPSGMVMSPNGPTMFQSGTLPGGPRYMRQASFPLGQQHFGSQQPLHRSMAPTNVIEMTEFYPQQHPNIYAHQQLPPVPHPQSAELPPLHGMSNGSMRQHPHSQMGYYPGSLTPSGASMKREPPTGGSIQDASAYGSLLQRSHLTGSMISDPHATGLMTPNPAAAAYYHGSQQTLHMLPPQYPNGHHQQQQPPNVMYSPRQSVMSPQPHQQYIGAYYPGQPLMQQMEHGPHGYGHTDGESIYSHFSQQEMIMSNTPQPLNPLMEENQAINGSGYIHSGMQAGGGGSQMNIGGPLGESSPVTGGSHRHHRRRRRKQPQQSRGQSSDMPNGGNTTNESADASAELIPQGGDQSEGELLNDDQQHPQPSFESELPGQKQRTQSLSGSGRGGYLDGDPSAGQQNFGPSPHANMNGMVDPTNREFCTRYDSSHRGGQLPPPNQPPPPPPPTGMGFGPSGTLMNGLAASPDPHHQIYRGLSQDAVQNRRIYSGTPVGNGSGGGGFGPSTSSGFLVDPPPRIRDYSEYGILRGMGLSPTPAGGQPQPPQHNVLMGNSPHTPALQQQTPHGTTMLYDGRYREGQA